MKQIKNFILACIKIITFGISTWIFAFSIINSSEMFSLMTSMSGVAITALFVGATTSALFTFIIMQSKMMKLNRTLKKENLRHRKCQEELELFKKMNSQLNAELATIKEKEFCRDFQLPD